MQKTSGTSESASNQTLSKRLQSLTAAEAEVMNIVWAYEPMSMPEIVERLPRPLAYSTVMTTVRILEAKGFLCQAGKKGRAFVYRSKVEKGEVRGTMVRQLAERLFGGSIKSLAMCLVQDQNLKVDDIKELKELIQRLENRE
jgi:BlaI family penicillinase repressor